MKYGRPILNMFNNMKSEINKHRADVYLPPMTLQWYIDDRYEEYQKFCRNIGIESKTLAKFLLSEVGAV